MQDGEYHRKQSKMTEKQPRGDDRLSGILTPEFARVANILVSCLLNPPFGILYESRLILLALSRRSSRSSMTSMSIDNFFISTHRTSLMFGVTMSALSPVLLRRQLNVSLSSEWFIQHRTRGNMVP
jgi:hypothetical protein